MGSTLSTRGGLTQLLSESRLIRVLRYPDFRLLWIGAFLSFTGSWVERIAQGYFVLELTHDDAFKLAAVAFANSIPVFLLGLFTGGFSDRIDKRKVLIWTQVVFALSALYLAIATYFHFVQYWHIITIALINGTVGSIEMPTRQSIVSRVVPAEELAAAVPINAMTFNFARILGPVIGALVLTKMGVAACYFLNAVSFAALVWTGFAIKSDLSPVPGERTSLKDLVLEGALYTMKDVRLRTLFILESLTACFGLAYLALLPAYVKISLGLKGGGPLGTAYTFVGAGALIGLMIGIRMADSKRKGTIIKSAMALMAVGLLILAYNHSPYVAYAVLAVIGWSSITQLNTTNALFQLLSPDRLRGRVLAMHIWALNGLSPFGVLLCGELAVQAPAHLTPGLPLAFSFCGVCMLGGTVAAFLSRRGLSGLYQEAVA